MPKKQNQRPKKKSTVFTLITFTVLVQILPKAVADDSKLFYFVNNLPTNAIFNDQTNTFSWAPSSRELGAHTLIFRVDDGWGERDAETITIRAIRTLPKELPDKLLNLRNRAK